MLFPYKIEGKDDWAQLFQSARAFEPLAKAIFQRHGLPFCALARTKPGTNAVFFAGEYVLKIFAPMESGFSTGRDYETERFGLARAAALGVSSPHLTASGTVQDRYRFDYLVMARVPGRELGEMMDALAADERMNIGRSLRAFVRRMDTPCEAFPARPLRSPAAEVRWACFPDTFCAEREAYLAGTAYGAPVYIHGDLTCDNILVTPEGGICVIDYADALTAPPEVELACVICEAFHLEKAFLKGFFGDYDPRALAETCLAGLLLHDFGANIICDRLAAPEELKSLAALRRKIRDRLDVSWFEHTGKE